MARGGVSLVNLVVGTTVAVSLLSTLLVVVLAVRLPWTDPSVPWPPRADWLVRPPADLLWPLVLVTSVPLVVTALAVVVWAFRGERGLPTVVRTAAVAVAAAVAVVGAAAAVIVFGLLLVPTAVCAVRGIPFPPPWLESRFPSIVPVVDRLRSLDPLGAVSPLCSWRPAATVNTEIVGTYWWRVWLPFALQTGVVLTMGFLAVLLVAAPVAVAETPSGPRMPPTIVREMENARLFAGGSVAVAVDDEAVGGGAEG